MSSWSCAPLGTLVGLHKDQITPSSSPDRMFSHYSIPAFDNGIRPSAEPGSAIKSNKFTIPANAVLVSRLNPRFTRVWTPEIQEDMLAICSTEFLVLRPQSINRRFLHYVCMSPRFRASLLANVTGTSGSHQRVPPASALRIEIPLPPPGQQRVIACILGTLDDKIELNRQMNATLEAMAQALFKSWFVVFEPVKAKMAVLEAGGTAIQAELAAMSVISAKDEAGIKQLQAEQPDAYAELAQTAALFPSTMEESELGEIPQGWEVSTIGEEVKISGGGTPSTKNQEYWQNGSIHWTTPKDLSNLSDKLLTDTERKITESGLEKISSGLLPIDTILMSSRAPVGYLALTKIPVAINQGYIAMQCENRLFPEFVLQWASSNMDEIKQRASGTTFAEISKKNFRTISVVVPPEGIVSVYSNKAKTIYDKVHALMVEIKTLSNLRDTLLPKLLSGELQISTGDTT